jgi:hypothetical protein
MKMGNLQIKHHYPPVPCLGGGNRAAMTYNLQIKRHYPDRGAMPDNLLV